MNYQGHKVFAKCLSSDMVLDPSGTTAYQPNAQFWAGKVNTSAFENLKR
jgi:hypothetical protein